MDRLLTDEEMTAIMKVEIAEAEAKRKRVYATKAFCRGQDAKTLQVVIDAINAYANKEISFERLAELLEINFYELDAAFQRWNDEYRKPTQRNPCQS